MNKKEKPPISILEHIPQQPTLLDGAKEVFALYSAYIEAGFQPQQALQITISIITANMAPPKNRR